MERNITRTKKITTPFNPSVNRPAIRYCTANIELNEGNLFITGEEGIVVSPKVARRMALDYWKVYFEDAPNAISEMNERCGTHFRSSKSAAKYVVEQDGDYHCLDAKEVDGKVYITESCGCIHDTLIEWFPEISSLIPFHLNNLQAGCVHQKQLNYGHGKTIALTNDTLTNAQRIVIEDDLHRSCAKARTKAFDVRWNKIITDSAEATRTLYQIRGKAAHITLSDVEDLSEYRARMVPHTSVGKEVRNWLKAEIAKEIPLKVFDAEIFKDSINAPCPSCGHRYGSSWTFHKLPDDIVKLAETVIL
jgi:hypothetical protein